MAQGSGEMIRTVSDASQAYPSSDTGLQDSLGLLKSRGCSPESPGILQTVLGSSPQMCQKKLIKKNNPIYRADLLYASALASKKTDLIFF